MDVCSFNGPVFAFILSPVNSSKIPLLGSSMRSAWRVAEVSAVLLALTDILGCEILFWVFMFLSVLRSEEKLVN